jgi:hypothetical protein
VLRNVLMLSTMGRDPGRGGEGDATRRITPGPVFQVPDLWSLVSEPEGGRAGASSWQINSLLQHPWDRGCHAHSLLHSCTTPRPDGLYNFTASAPAQYKGNKLQGSAAGLQPKPRKTTNKPRPYLVTARSGRICQNMCHLVTLRTEKEHQRRSTTGFLRV